MKKIACVGDCMVELAGIGTRPQIGIGGDTLNCAVYLQRCLLTTQVSYVTRLGTDPLSSYLLKLMHEESLDTARIKCVPGALPALYAITLEQGERSFHYWRDQAPARDLFKTPQPQLEIFLQNVACMLASGISLAVLTPAGRGRLLACARQGDSKFAYLVNHRPILWRSKAVALQAHSKALQLSAFGFISKEELALLWPARDSIRKLSRMCAGELVMTAGVAGCEIWHAGMLLAKVATQAVKAVDTTAAGDSFAARYLAGRLSGEEPAVAAQQACKLAAVVVRHDGAIVPRAKMPRTASIR